MDTFSSLDDDSHADLTLVSCAKEYSAHRVIVCPQSSVIARKLLSKFRSTKQDPSCDSCGVTPRHRFDFSQDDPRAVDCLIQYFYRQDYQSGYRGLATKDSSPGETEGTIPPPHLDEDSIDDSYPTFHVRVYALAEFYEVPALKELALEKFNKVIQDSSRLGRLLDGVEEAYESTIEEDRGLRDAVVDFFYNHSDLVDEKQVRETIQKTKSLSYDLFIRWHEHRTTPKRIKPLWPGI